MKPQQPPSAPRATTRPGWHEVPGMENTLGFWDGEAWTQQWVPKPAATANSAPPLDVWLIARGVALGTIMASIIAAFLFWVVLQLTGGDDCTDPLTGESVACSTS